MTVHFAGDVAVKQVRGRVVRCEVSAIKEGALHYRTAVAFATPLPLPGEPGEPDANTAAPPAPPASAVRNRW